ncbi:TolC family protein [Novosphingobium resinovorum]|nr:MULTISPECIES: TolC family protein [Sphingomonadaceae]MBF7014634.1 TolC family protein [Novosphingobium sp. HR1a]WJM24886.1 TolC family protein [Novosphingobium resinovorum]
MTVCPALRRAEAMTVEEAVAAAIARHPALSAAASEVKAAHTEVKVARSGYLPSISASGGPQEVSTEKWAYEVTAAQMVHDWGQTRSRTDGARAAERQARAEWSMTRDEAVRDVIETYLDVVLARLQREVDLAQISTLEDLSRMTGMRADGGYADRSEPDRAQLELARAHQRLASDDGQAANAGAQFETLVGTPPGHLEQPVPASMVRRIETQNIDTLIDEAPAFRKALEETHYARAQFDDARSSILPRVNLEATALSREIGGRMASDAVVALRLRMTPLQGLSLFDRADAARQRVNAAQLKEAAVRRDIARELRNLMTTATALEQQAQALRAQVSDAGNLSGLYREQFEVGRRDIVDLVTIQREHFDARRSLNEVMLQMARTQYRIAAQLGRLSDLVALPPELP